jgi:hypothetical protein
MPCPEIVTGSIWFSPPLADFQIGMWLDNVGMA